MTHQEQRKVVYNKFNGHCAYCGEEITIKQMQVDHKNPIYRNVPKDADIYKRGEDVLSNKFPACAKCNNFKHVWTIEEFRREISMQIKRAKKTSANYRMCIRYGLIKETPHPIVFYFEKDLIKKLYDESCR